MLEHMVSRGQRNSLEVCNIFCSRRKRDGSGIRGCLHRRKWANLDPQVCLSGRKRDSPGVQNMLGVRLR